MLPPVRQSSGPHLLSFTLSLPPFSNPEKGGGGWGKADEANGWMEVCAFFRNLLPQAGFSMCLMNGLPLNIVITVLLFVQGICPWFLKGKMVQNFNVFLFSMCFCSKFSMDGIWRGNPYMGWMVWINGRACGQPRRVPVYFPSGSIRDRGLSTCASHIYLHLPCGHAGYKLRIVKLSMLGHPNQYHVVHTVFIQYDVRLMYVIDVCYWCDTLMYVIHHTCVYLYVYLLSHCFELCFFKAWEEEGRKILHNVMLSILP